jgi:hypothetical protein
MKTTKWLGLAAAIALPLLSGYAQAPEAQAPATAAVAATLSPNVAEVVKLAESGSSDEVMLAYIQNSPSTFDLTADQILYLRDIGLSSPVIAAMLNRDSMLRGQPQPPTQPMYPPATQPAVAPPPVPAPAPVPVEAPPVVAPAPVYVSTPPPDVTYFYSDLAPYGAWVQLDGIGWCWQPRVVVINHGWRPYCEGGHWIYSDAGWYWASDYSWGWAPFHYGRWHLHDRCGWVWLPDRVWGPAWVSWRFAGDNCGWAPLPPHAEFDLHLGWRFNGVSVASNFDFGLGLNVFTFVGLKDFSDRDLGHRRLPPAEATRLYHQTTIINNYTVNNNLIVNRGIPVERVSAATHTQIKRAAIRDLPAGTERPTRTQSANKAGLVVYRPQLKAPAQPVRMEAQRVDDRHPVQHAPIIPVNAERRNTPNSGSWGPASNPHGNQPVAPRNSVNPVNPVRPGSPARPVNPVSPANPVNPVNPVAPAGNRAGYTPQHYPAPKYQAEANPARGTTPTRHTDQSQTTAQANTVRPPTPAPSPAPSATRTPEPSRPASAFTGTPTQGSSERRPTPSQTTATAANPARQPSNPPPNSRSTQTAPSQPASAGQASHVYYPKSYHQAAEAHILPPLNAAPTSKPAPAETASGSQPKKGGF